MLFTRNPQTPQCAARTFALVAGCALLLAGCASSSEPKLVAPITVVAPYDTSRGEVLWAVVPLRNESGTSLVDINALTDKVVVAAEEVQGVRCLPLNRTLAAMNVMGLTALHSPQEAQSLAQAMGVDAILVGSITAYDPYIPSIGLSLALFPKAGSMAPGRQPLDPRTLTVRPTEGPAGDWPRDTGPISVVSEHLDAKNHQVLMEVRSYAEGRQKMPSALGWRRYTASMDLFCEFAAHRVVAQMIQQEWVRLPGSAPGRTAAAHEEH